jgi:hypothetical protein
MTKLERFELPAGDQVSDELFEDLSRGGAGPVVAGVAGDEHGGVETGDHGDLGVVVAVAAGVSEARRVGSGDAPAERDVLAGRVAGQGLGLMQVFERIRRQPSRGAAASVGRGELRPRRNRAVNGAGTPIRGGLSSSVGT